MTPNSVCHQTFFPVALQGGLLFTHGRYRFLHRMGGPTL